MLGKYDFQISMNYSLFRTTGRFKTSRISSDLQLGSTITPRIGAAAVSTGSELALMNRSVEEMSMSEFKHLSSLKNKVNLICDNDISELFDLIKNDNPCLKNIEVISFGDVNRDNELLIQKLLDAIFEKEMLFPSFKKLTFGDIHGDLIFPNFQVLETLIVKNVFGKLVMANFPMLKNIEYGGGSGTYDLENFKAALMLRGLSKIELRGGLSAIDILSDLLKYPGKESNSRCIETIVINPVHKSDFWDVKWLLDCIHSNQELLSGLKRIEIDNSVFTFESKGLEPEALIEESSKAKFVELLKKLHEQVEIVYFTGSGARPVSKR